MHKPKTAIMATGGMDSTTLLYKYASLNPIPITINYGHLAFAKEVEMLSHHIKKLGLPDLQIIDIKYADWQIKPGLFQAGYKPAEENPLEDWDKLRYADFFIEGRNMIMVAYALAWCSAHGVDELLAGYLYAEKEWENRRTYKLMTGDNSPQFVDTMNLLTNMGLSHQVRFRAPYYEQRLSKEDVYQEGLKMGVDFSYTHSCYFVPACGKCDNCLLRKDIIS